MNVARLVSICILVTASVSAQSQSSQSVTLYRDARGRPHAVSTDDAAAYYGFGLAQMRDLPVTLATNMAMASGELASIFGPGPISVSGLGQNVHFDLRTRLHRIEEIATSQIAAMPTDIKQKLDAYVQGLNFGRLEWLGNAAQLAFNTEPRFHDLATIQRLLSRPITLDDVVRHGVQMNGLTAISVMETLAWSQIPGAQESHLRTASNSFAIGPKASTSGKSMLVMDPHLGFQDLGQLRANFAHISGGSTDVAGITFPGFPCIVMGFTDKLAWALTANNPDVSDVWQVATTPTGSDFMFDGQPRPIIRDTVLIEVWNDVSDTLNTEVHERAYAGSLDRPVIREIAAAGGSGGEIWYGGATFATSKSLFEFFIRLSEAADVGKARNVFDMNVILSNNVLMTDSKGTLGHIHAGRVPLRGPATPGTTWAQVQDGSSSAYQWSQVHPAADLPYEALKSKGNAAPQTHKWVQCNTTADRVRIGTNIDLNDYPEYMVHPTTTDLSWRQVRGRELLSSATPINGAELRAIAIDDLDLWWRAVEPLADQVMTEFGLWQNANLATTMNRMAAWNRSTAPDLAEPLISHLVRACYGRELSQMEQAGQPLPSVVDFSFPTEVPDLATWTSAGWLPNRQAMATALVKADQTWRDCINPVLPQLTFPGSPWTPAPWQGLSQQEAVWGTAHYINLTPYSAPANAAGYPAPGNVSLLTLESSFIERPWETILENATVLGQTGTLIQFPVDAGAHTMLQVEFASGGPDAWFLEAIGPTEVADDPDRYRFAADFAAGNWQPFVTNIAVVAATSVSSETLGYTPQGNGNNGNGN